jgi:hypothetical protein
MTRQPAAPKPLPIWPGGDRYPRRGVWRGSAMVPAVSLKTTVRLRPWLAERSDQPREILISLTQAATAALALHPRVNFFNCDGRMVWAGPEPRVAVVMENQDLTCDLVLVPSAHEMNRKDVGRALIQRDGKRPQPPMNRLRQLLPSTCFNLERWTRLIDRRLVRYSAPLFISMLGLPGIEELSFAPTTSMALYPGWPENGRLPLTLSFSHQLGNARPVARFLLTVRDLLE